MVLHDDFPRPSPRIFPATSRGARFASPLRRIFTFLLIHGCLTLSAVGAFAQAGMAKPDPLPAPTAPDEQWSVLEQRPGDGEQCLVCGLRIQGDEVSEILYRGRVFHVASKMLDAFEGDPDRFFRRLQARAGLFDEEAMPGEAGALSAGWLVFGLYVLAGLIFGALCGFVAVDKALRPIPWFFAGFGANIFAFLALLLARRGRVSRMPEGIPRGLVKVPVTRTPMECPKCGASNHPAAGACSSCGAALKPTVSAETAKV